jgi:hypothetical protein
MEETWTNLLYRAEEQDREIARLQATIDKLKQANLDLEKKAMAMPEWWTRNQQQHRAQAEADTRRHGAEPGLLQWKWRGFDPKNPMPQYDPVIHSYEMETAIIDALVFQGGIDAWPGDGVSCVKQIVDAVAIQAREESKRRLEISRKFKEKWQSDCYKAQARVSALEKALESLATTVDRIGKSKELQGVFAYAAVHGCKYVGESWEQVLSEAFKVLGEKDEPRGGSQ